MSLTEVTIYPFFLVGTINCNVSHFPAPVTGNLWAAMTFMPGLLAGPAGQPLVLVVLLWGSGTSLYIHILVAQSRGLSELTEALLVGCPVLPLVGFPLERRPYHRNKLI